MLTTSKEKTFLVIVIVVLLCAIVGVFIVRSNASFIRHLVTNKISQTQQVDTTNVPIPTAIKSTTYAYGTQKLEAIDVYSSSNMKDAPIIVMVHGGAWYIGDKSNTNVWKNKVTYWGPKGYIFVSVNYPMMNDGYKPDAQANEVAKALAYVQTHASQWGGNPNKIVLMGHSAGAHLASLVSVTRTTNYPDLKPWAGTVLLDSAAYDLKAMMLAKPADFYVNSFGSDPAYWTKTSPDEQLTVAVEPLFLVCSSNRADSDCNQAEAFKNKAIGLGGTAVLRAEALSHEEINTTLGLPSAYTSAVDAFIAGVTK